MPTSNLLSHSSLVNIPRHAIIYEAIISAKPPMGSVEFPGTLIYCAANLLSIPLGGAVVSSAGASVWVRACERTNGGEE
jgi:hypothetical protein